MKALLFALAACLLLGACASTEVIKVVPVAGGRSERFVFSQNGPAPAEDENALVTLAAVLPNKDTQQVAHSFMVKPLSKKKWTRIVITEITQDPETLILDVKDPKIASVGQWVGSGQPLVASDRNLAWVNHESVTTLVYRIRITYEDGTSSNLPVASIVHPGAKAYIKKQLGL
jgi:hypothetical protein